MAIKIDSTEYKTLLNVRMQLLTREGLYNGRMEVNFIERTQHLEWYDVMTKMQNEGLLTFAITDSSRNPLDRQALEDGQYDELCYQLIRVNHNRMKEYLWNKSPTLAFFKVTDPDHVKELCRKSDPDALPLSYNAVFKIGEARIIITVLYKEYGFPIRFSSQSQKIFQYAKNVMNKNPEQQEFRITRQELMQAGIKFKKGQTSLATILRNNQLVCGVLTPFAVVDANSLTLFRSKHITAKELQQIKEQSQKYKF